MSTTLSDPPTPLPARRSLRSRLLRRAVLLPVLAVVAAAATVFLYLFQPWALVVDKTVNEAAPSGVSAGAPAGEPAGGEAEKPAAEGPKVLATGDFISHEHATAGSVRIVALADGSRVLRLEGLDTSNGPDLKVWLTDAPVLEGRAGWSVFDDGRYVDLGKLKGNQGSQNYAIPASVDLDALTSISIWCDRFNVSFGAAELRA